MMAVTTPTVVVASLFLALLILSQVTGAEQGGENCENHLPPLIKHESDSDNDSSKGGPPPVEPSDIAELSSRAAATRPLVLKGDFDSSTASWSDEHIPKKKVAKRKWDPSWTVSESVSIEGRPIILTHSVASTWAAVEEWTPRFLSQHPDLDVLKKVKVAKGPRETFFDLDKDSQMMLANRSQLFFWDPQVHYENFEEMPGPQFFDTMYNPDAEDLVYTFAIIANKAILLRDLQPLDPIWLSSEDQEIRYLTLWAGSAGPEQHLHFDSDHNFYSVISGKKRFVIYSPAQLNNLYIYPRIHPMWHKSQVDYHHPNLTAFPNYANAQAYEAIVGPGEVLYIPPYHWHFVQTLEPTIAVAAWSKKKNLYQAMRSAYDVVVPSRTEHLPIELKKIALQAEIVLIIENIYGAGATKPFLENLLAQRYSTLRHHFKASLPTGCYYTSEFEYFAAENFYTIGLVIRDFGSIDNAAIRAINIGDFIELQVSYLFGVDYVPAFFESCFSREHPYVNYFPDGVPWRPITKPL